MKATHKAYYKAITADEEFERAVRAQGGTRWTLPHGQYNDTTKQAYEEKVRTSKLYHKLCAQGRNHE